MDNNIVQYRILIVINILKLLFFAGNISVRLLDFVANSTRVSVLSDSFPILPPGKDKNYSKCLSLWC